MASSTTATTQGVPVEAPNPPSELVSTEKSTQAKGVVIGESTPISTEISTPQKRVIYMGASQTESISPATPLPVISASDPFVALSQAIKDGSSLVVTLSCIPNSATREPDVDLSSNEGSEEVLEDSDDKPVMRTQVSDSDETNDDEQRVEAISMYPLLLLCLLFLLFLLLLSAFLYLPCILLLPRSN